MPYTPPYNWAAMIQFRSARATPGVEKTDDRGYRRTIGVHGYFGSIAVAPMPGADALAVDIEIGNPACVPAIVERVARMFDVDVDPAPVAGCLEVDSLLKRACETYAGIRLPGAWDPFELAVRAILGQQVSVTAATTMAGRVAERWGDNVESEHDLDRLFPWPSTLADAPLEEVGIIRARANTIRSLSQLVAAKKIDLTSPAVLDELTKVPGIGPWTAQYFAMCALQQVDAFPSGDLVLRRAVGNLTARALEARSERWRPWRAYAVMLLWQRAGENPAPRKRRSIRSLSTSSRNFAAKRRRPVARRKQRR
jgi:AraC family transcriptional regulator of adaptative response / DNA-3-methyladenine glycosylase II